MPPTPDLDGSDSNVLKGFIHKDGVASVISADLECDDEGCKLAVRETGDEAFLKIPLSSGKIERLERHLGRTLRPGATP